VPSKWDIDTAIQASHMAPNARLIMFVFISAADPETAAIPERFTPSLEDIASRTGLSKSTVAEWLTVLEDSGWIKRDRPSIAESLGSGRRTCYVLAIGDMEGSPKPQRVRKTRTQVAESTDTATHSGVRVADSPRGGQSEAVEGPRGGQSGVRVADSDSPRGGHKSSPSHQAHLPPTGAAPDGAADALFELDPEQQAAADEAEIKTLTGSLVGDWVKHCAAHNIKLNEQVKARFGQAIRKLLDEHIDPETIRAALIRMRERGKASRPAMLHEFVVDVQNPAASRTTPALAVSSSSDFKKWQKGTSS
jgi:DNA-binding Lrp family transcriptional regulator